MHLKYLPLYLLYKLKTFILCYYLCWQHGNVAFSVQMLEKVFFTFLQHGGVFLLHGCEFTNVKDFPLHSYYKYIINTLCIAIYFVVTKIVCICNIWTLCAND